tara:strand:+ start:682 stop:960 length:279 start_codon:yes stop_codon:yes gene_type:complete
MALAYLIVPEAALRTLDFSWVKEKSWETCRWSNDRREAYIHWTIGTETLDFIVWQRDNRLDRSITTQADANTYTRNTAKNSWNIQPTPPPRP